MPVIHAGQDQLPAYFIVDDALPPQLRNDSSGNLISCKQIQFVSAGSGLRVNPTPPLGLDPAFYGWQNCECLGNRQLQVGCLCNTCMEGVFVHHALGAMWVSLPNSSRCSL